MHYIQYIAVGFFLIILLFGEMIINLLPSFKKIKFLSKPLGGCTLGKELTKQNFNLKVLCQTPFISKYYVKGENEIKIEDGEMNFSDVFAIVSYYEKTIHHILKELKIYSLLTLILITVQFFTTLNSTSESHDILHLLPFFEIFMFIIFSARLLIEYMKVSSLIE